MPPRKSGNKASHEQAEKPLWNAELRELKFLGRLVKRLRQMAAIQEMVFNEFEKRKWCQSIENILPRRAGRNPKRYLRMVIENLNRHQHFRAIEFFADGTGHHICWRPTRRATALLLRESS